MLMCRTLALALCGVLAAPAISAFGGELQLTGTLRDLKRGDWQDGHPDFETANTVSGHGSYGRVSGLVTMNLGDDGKPVYGSTRPSNDTIQSAQSLHTWFSDDPAINVSVPHTLTLTPSSANASIYTVAYTGSNQFFPLNNKGFGNQGLNNNFHFTFELKTTFAYSPGQEFTFVGDDDVWVYVNGVKVIDLGGVHSAATGKFRLFDGKAFVTKAHFTEGGVVQKVTSSMAGQLASKWSWLGLPGTCPILSGDLYIDLDLTNGGSDVRCEFAGTSVTVYASRELSNVVLMLDNGQEVKFDNQSGYSQTYTNANQIVGVWVKTGPNFSGDGPGYGQYHTPTGSTHAATLDFFFAERHTTQSNFRIDTSINLVEVPPSTISPLYD